MLPLPRLRKLFSRPPRGWDLLGSMLKYRLEQPKIIIWVPNVARKAGTFSLETTKPLKIPKHIPTSIATNEIDLVLLFTDPNTTDPWDDSQMIETIRYCDKHNVPIATNLASAEMSIMGLQRGDLDWREMLHTKPRY